MNKYMTALTRPSHKRYALASVNDQTYIKFVNGYSLAKKCGVKGVWIYITGSSVKDLCMEVLKGQVRYWGRRKLASGLLAGMTYVSSPLVCFVTNSTQVMRIANATHTAIAFAAETCEDATALAWLPLDLALCGQMIPIGAAGRYNLMGGDASIFPFLGDL